MNFIVNVQVISNIYTIFSNDSAPVFCKTVRESNSATANQIASSIYFVNRDCHCFRQGSHTNKVIITAGTNALRR